MSGSRQNRQRSKVQSRQRQNCCQRFFSSAPVGWAASFLAGSASAATTYWAAGFIPDNSKLDWFPAVRYTVTGIAFVISTGLTALGITASIGVQDKVLAKAKKLDKDVNQIHEFLIEDQDLIAGLEQGLLHAEKNSDKQQVNLIALRDALAKTMRTVKILFKVLEPIAPNDTRPEVATQFNNESKRNFNEEDKKGPGFEKTITKIMNIERHLPRRPRPKPSHLAAGDLKAMQPVSQAKLQIDLGRLGLFDETKQSAADRAEPLLAGDRQAHEPAPKPPKIKRSQSLDDASLDRDSLDFDVDPLRMAASAAALQQQGRFRPADSGRPKEPIQPTRGMPTVIVTRSEKKR